MGKSKTISYILLPEWSIAQRGKYLIISGGADARFEIELESNDPSFFSALKSDTTFTRSKLGVVDQRVLEELTAAEIIVPKLQKNKTLRVTVLGDSSELTPTANASVKVVTAGQDYDLSLIVRVQSTYSDLLKGLDYQTITKPHLFVDAAFHHTLSIGPLVFPGETACIACLQGRVSTRWGDEAPPIKPLVTKEYGKLVSELVTAELARIAKDDTTLTNKTITWNFRDRTTKKDLLLKVPMCPVCAQNSIDQSGALALPWSKV